MARHRIKLGLTGIEPPLDDLTAGLDLLPAAEGAGLVSRDGTGRGRPLTTSGGGGLAETIRATDGILDSIAVAAASFDSLGLAERWRTDVAGSVVVGNLASTDVDGWHSDGVFLCDKGRNIFVPITNL